MGGVCGRQIEVKGADDGMDNGRYRANAEEMNGQVLGLISGITAGDAAGAEVVERNKIPVVSTPVSSQFQAVSTVFDINPPYADPNATIAKYRWLSEQGARKASLIYPERKSGVSGKSVSGRVNLGGSRIIKKKKK